MNIYDNYYLNNANFKRSLINNNPIMLTLLFLDLSLSFVYGIYYNINFYLIPTIIPGIIGVWSYRSKFLYLYQICNSANICIKCYTIILYGEPYLWSLMTLQFYFIYKHWFYIFQIKQLSNEEIDIVRKGWNGYFENI